MTDSTPPKEGETPSPGDHETRIRVVVADDRFFARLGVCEYLDMMPQIEVVGEAENGPETIRVVRELQPDVLLLEASLPDMDGAEVVRRLRSEDGRLRDGDDEGDEGGDEEDRSRSPRVVVHSENCEDRKIEKLVDLGVAGYVDKRDSPAYLLEAIRNVARGSEDWYSPRVSRVIIGLRRRNGVLQRYALTKREKEVLQFLSEGLSNSMIAQRLYVTEGTIKNHLTSIYEKLDVSSRAQAIVWMREHDLL